MKKAAILAVLATLAILAITAALLLAAGCAGKDNGPSVLDKFTEAVQAGCDHKEAWLRYKAKFGSMLSTLQVGYPVVVALANQFKANALNPDKVAAGVEQGFKYVRAVDTALDLLGQLYFDKICPSEEDLAEAKAAYEEAQAAKHALGIDE